MYYKKRSILKNIFSHSLTLTFVGIIVLVLISLPLIKNIKKQININNEISTLEYEIKNLEGKNTELKGLITYLNSDEFAEEQARLNLNYKKNGEEVLIIKDKEELNSPENTNVNSKYNIKGLENIATSEQPNNYKKWINYFLN